MYTAGTKLHAHLAWPLFSVEELEAHRREVTKEGQILASGQAGARIGLWI